MSTRVPARIASLRGIALVETLMGITILILGLGAATMLALQLLRGTNATKQQVVATSLARDALEALRNIRDTNWQANSGSQRDAGNTTREHWNDGFKDAYLTEAGADYIPVLDSSACLSHDPPLPAPCPFSRWRLINLGVADADDGVTDLACNGTTAAERSQMFEVTATGALSNICKLSTTPETPTRYRRWIHINYLNPADGSIAYTGVPTLSPTKEVWAEVVVQWYSSTNPATWPAVAPNELRLSTTLTDWFGRKEKN